MWPEIYFFFELNAGAWEKKEGKRACETDGVVADVEPRGVRW
jgi:hypothetical protein